jgi:hypothetical protein
MFDDEEVPEKISLDELYEGKQKRDLRVLSTFKTVLARVHKQIKLTSRQKIDQQYCWFVIPEFMFGIPSYNHQDCAVFIVSKLQENGFLVKYTHPNLLLISWQHWVPSYVRQELKKKTGMEIDGTGSFVKKPGDNAANSLNLNSDGMRNIPMNPMANFVNNSTNPVNMETNMNINTNTSINLNTNTNETKDYKDIKSYNPTGGLVYKEQLLQDLHRKLKLK